MYTYVQQAQHNNRNLLMVYVVCWMRMAPIGSLIHVLGLQLELIGNG